MARLTRSESQALTRDRLLEAARELFSKEGYATTSVEHIADAAGYSKGAVYSNFPGKQAIFLAVLDAQGQVRFADLMTAIEGAKTTEEVVELLAEWAGKCSKSGSWSLTILEHARSAGPSSASVLDQERIIREHWRRVGECLQKRFPGVAEDAETLGALLHEIAYAPAMSFVSRPTAGDLMRLAMGAILRSGT